MLVLSVEVNELPAEFLKRAGGRESVVDERATSTLSGHFAPEDDLAAVSCFQRGLDDGFVRSGSNEIGGRSRSDEEPKGSEDDRFARAGLASQNRETRRELDLELFDDSEIFDAEKPNHSGRAESMETPSYHIFDRYFTAC